jgi:hypothetical protein
VLTDAFGPRWVWGVAGGVYVLAALLALLATRWLPVSQLEESEILHLHAEAAASAIAAGSFVPAEATPSTFDLEPAAPEPGRNESPRDGSARGGLDRIATLLEEIERRREREARRPTT